MIVGITGTRKGLTDEQAESLRKQLGFLVVGGMTEFHHGCCVGVDCQSSVMLRELAPQVKIVAHPPIKTELIGTYVADETRVPLDYFARNRQIVLACSELIVCPMDSSHQARGGTWYTFDYAKKLGGKIVSILWGNGRITTGDPRIMETIDV